MGDPIDPEDEGPSSPPTPPRAAPGAGPAPGASTQARSYTVESGDSWIGIARDHGISYSQLLEANPGANPERIRIGQVLRIPAAASARAPAVERSHRVASGDTLSEIAERYGVSTRSLRSANDLTSDVIRAGQVLRIPAE